MVKLLLEDDKPYVIKNGETRKTTGLKNGGQGLPGLATEVVEACLTWKIPPSGLVDNQHFGLLGGVIQLAHFGTHLGVITGQIGIIFHQPRDFPEIRGFPLLFTTIWGKSVV